MGRHVSLASTLPLLAIFLTSKWLHPTLSEFKTIFNVSNSESCLNPRPEPAQEMNCCDDTRNRCKYQ